MLWGAYNLFWNDDKSSPPPPTPEISIETAMASAEATAKAATPAVNDSIIERLAHTKWGSDPFVRQIKKSTRKADNQGKKLELILSGIVFSEKSPMAVINSRMVRVGDIVDGGKVIRIDPESVTVEINGKRKQLQVTKG